MKINKDVLKAFFWVMLISVFAASVIYLTKSQNKDQIRQLQELKGLAIAERHRSELAEQRANIKRDSAMSVMLQTRSEFAKLNTQYNTIVKNIAGIRIDLDSHLFELQNIKDEKANIPDATLSEQVDFLSKFRYTEY